MLRDTMNKDEIGHSFLFNSIGELSQTDIFHILRSARIAFPMLIQRGKSAQMHIWAGKHCDTDCGHAHYALRIALALHGMINAVAGSVA
jgi:hypothetical protein